MKRVKIWRCNRRGREKSGRRREREGEGKGTRKRKRMMMGCENLRRRRVGERKREKKIRSGGKGRD